MFAHKQHNSARKSTGLLISPRPDQKGNKLQRLKILMFIYPIYNHNWRNISNGIGHPATGRGGPRGSVQVKAPDPPDARHHKRGRSSTSRTGRPYPQEKSLAPTSRGQADSRAHGFVGSHGRIPSDTTGNRSRDLPTSSAAPQPPRHPRPQNISTIYIYNKTSKRNILTIKRNISGSRSGQGPTSTPAYTGAPTSP